MIRFYYSPDGLYKNHNDFIAAEASESFVVDKANNKLRLFDSTDFYFQTLSDTVDVNHQNASVGLSQKGAYLMKSQIDASINALKTHDGVLDSSVNIINSSIVKINSSIGDVSTRLASANTSISKINSSIGDVSTRLASANTNIGKINSSIGIINSSIGKIANDLAQHKVDCNNTHDEFSKTWAAALVDIRKDIDDLKKRL